MGRFWHGATLGLASLLGIFLVLTSYARVAPPTPSLGNFLAVLKLLAQMSLFGLGFLLVVKVVARLPSRYLWVLACTLATGAYYFGRFEGWGQFWTAFFFVVPATLVGGFMAVAERNDALAPRLGVGLGVAGLVYGLFVFVRPGFVVTAPENAALRMGTIPRLGRPDPGERGAHNVQSLTYGSGRDRHRSEFAGAVDLTTESVDGSAFIEGWEGRSGWARTQYWGFDATELPLQGRVWHPDGDGPFPLVLIVHGNHSMEDFSDPGYAYLGELFASRGVIFVSVDENFINSSFSGRLDELYGRGLKTENDARGWLLLKHLEVWRNWNASPGHLFYERVDMERIGLIGHSRGGEAVAVAAAFNRLDRYPDDANVTFDFDFAIQGIAAIAPVDGQYKPGGRGTPIADVNYFVLHGSHVGDVQSFAGSRQFERVELTGERFRFKSSLYVYGANHGQFNTTWGRTDTSFPGKQFLNLTNIMPPDEQETIARVTLSAFFEICLRDELDYLPLFSDARVGADWLPETIYLAHYEDSTDTVVADFDEDLDVMTTTLPGGALLGENLTEWSETLVELKYDDKGTSAVVLAWDHEDEDSKEGASYTVSLPPGLSPTSEHTLAFALAAGDQEEDAEAIDFSLELVDTEGTVARLPLSTFSLLQPPIDVQVRKSKLFNRSKTSEPVYQSFSFSLDAFRRVAPELDTTGLASLRFVFDRTRQGRVMLDHIVFREASR